MGLRMKLKEAEVSGSWKMVALRGREMRLLRSADCSCSLASMRQWTLVSQGKRFHFLRHSAALKPLALRKKTLPLTKRLFLMLTTPLSFFATFLSCLYFFHSSLMIFDILSEPHRLCFFLWYTKWSLQNFMQAVFGGFPIFFDFGSATISFEESEAILLSTSCSEPLLQSESERGPEGARMRVLEGRSWGVRAARLAATSASLRDCSALMRASEEEMSSCVRNFFSSQIFWRLSLATGSSRSHSLMILETISDSRILGNWCLYLLYFCRENYRYTLLISSFRSYFPIQISNQIFLTATQLNIGITHLTKTQAKIKKGQACGFSGLWLWERVAGCQKDSQYLVSSRHNSVAELENFIMLLLLLLLLLILLINPFYFPLFIMGFRPVGDSTFEAAVQQPSTQYTFI